MQRFIFSFFVVSISSTLLKADEGMWTYDNLPVEAIERAYGFKVTPEWAEHLMLSSVRLNSGGSGSFVSGQGLVLTNHHVAEDTLAKLSTPEKDLLTLGYMAGDKEAELRAPDLEINQLVSILDVSDRVAAAVKPEMTAAEANLARRKIIAEIQSENEKKTGLRSDVVTLYNGGKYHLYQYKRYTDVRLVFAPEKAIGFFGGDADNFEFPRYCLDMALFRVYENGVPAKTSHFLTWSDTGPSNDELVFVSGHPGKTSRLLTVSEMKDLRDRMVPDMLGRLHRLEVLYQQYGLRGPEFHRQAESFLFSVQNSRKVYLGRRGFLQDPKFFEKKEKDEIALRALVNQDPALSGYKDIWARIDQALIEQKRLAQRFNLLEGGRGFGSNLFAIARTLVRLAAEDSKPNGERLPEYQDAQRTSLKLRLFSKAPVYPALEATLLADGLSTLFETLGADHDLVVKILDGKSVLERAQEMATQSQLYDVSVREKLASGGPVAIAQSQDPLIRLAALVDGPSRAIRAELEALVEEPKKQAYEKLAKLRFQLYGTDTYPDATFSLRLAYGKADGYTYKGQEIPYATTLGDAFVHEENHKGQKDFDLPASWHAAKEKLAGSKTVFNFVSTADIIGGNSGSPVVNRKGDCVGLIFDGNIESLRADYVYDDTVSRATSVGSGAIKEALSEIYNAKHLAAELGH